MIAIIRNLIAAQSNSNRSLRLAGPGISQSNFLFNLSRIVSVLGLTDLGLQMMDSLSFDFLCLDALLSNAEPIGSSRGKRFD